jgi:TATA-binding protein-associated factor
MPSHTIASALIKLWLEGEVPWRNPSWQIATGVKHGLFPDDDKLLPPRWTRSMATDIKSFFIRYSALPNEDQKIKFASTSAGEIVPGRLEWRKWVRESISKWKLQAIVVNGLKECSIHPYSLVSVEDEDDWPLATLYIPIALDYIGLELCGLAESTRNGLLRPPLRAPITYIVQHVWNALRRQYHRSRSGLPNLLSKATSTLAALEDGPTKSKVTIALRAISKFQEMASLLGTEAQCEMADSMVASVNSIMGALGASISSDKKKKGMSTYSCVLVRY